MVSEILIKIWKNQGMSEEEINKKIDLEKGRRIKIDKKTGEIKKRNRKKLFSETISFRLTPFLAERLDRYIFQQLNYPTKRKGAIYRHIFKKFLKSFYKNNDFDWNDSGEQAINNKSMEEQGK